MVSNYYWIPGPLTRGVPCQWAEILNFWFIDMGIPMSVRLGVGPLTWGAPCQWSENIEIQVHWHGEPHVTSRQYWIFGILTWGSPCQCVRKLVHWHGEPHVTVAEFMQNGSIDMGIPMSITHKSLRRRHDSPDLARNTILIRSSVYVRTVSCIRNMVYGI